MKESSRSIRLCVEVATNALHVLFALCESIFFGMPYMMPYMTTFEGNFDTVLFRS